MRVGLVVLAVVLLQSCRVDPNSSSHNLASLAAGDTFVAIDPSSSKDSLKIWLSSKTRDRLGVCLVKGDEQCSASHASYVQAHKVFEKNGRNILGLDKNIPAQATATYVVLAEGGTVDLKFALKDPSVVDADPVGTGLALIQKETIREELNVIAGDDFKGRLTGTADNVRAADWIIEQLKKIGIEAAVPNYRQNFKVNIGSGTTANIVAKIEGSDPVLKNEYVIVGAHMDHIGTLERGYGCRTGTVPNDSICNGADDNASGTIAVLNVAKALSAVRANLKRSVILIWFSGEEEGLYGSYHYVRSPVVPLNKTIYMINMDMVGYLKSNSNQILALGGGTSDTGKKIMQDAARKYSGVGLYVTRDAGGGSDHVAFMAKGIPGVFFHTGVDSNANYHRTGDNPNKIDFDGMTVATKIAFETAFRVTNGDKSVSVAEDETRLALIDIDETMPNGQGCHELIKNPFARKAVDFTNGNDGG